MRTPGYLRTAGFVLLLALAAGLAACGSAANAPDPTPISVSAIEWASDAAWHEKGQQAVGAAAKSVAGTDVRSVMFQTPGEYQEAVKANLGTAKAYPMFDWWFAYRMKELVDMGDVADVTSIWEKHIAAGEYPSSLMNSFGFNGRAYALPKGVNYWVVFYNKQIFDKYNLEPPQTWDEFMSIAQTLKENDVTPFGLDITTCEWCGFIWFEELLVRTDPSIYSRLMDGKLRYNDPEVIEVMLKWKDLLDRGYFTEPGLVDDDTSGMAFAGSVFAMYLIGDWWTANAETAGLRANKDYGIFVMPGITEKGSNALIIEGRPVLIAEHSPYKEAALEMADYFMGVEGQTIWARESKSNSPNLKVPEDSRPEHLRALASDVSDGEYTLLPRYWEATPPEIVEKVVVLLDKFVQEPASYRALMNEAQALADAYWVSHR